MSHSKSKAGFLTLLFSSFFRWWWAAITGFATLLSIFLVKSDFQFSKEGFIILIFLGLTLLFLCVSTMYQGWLLYQNRFTTLIVAGCQRSDIYQSEIIFIIEGADFIEKGTVAELKRFIDGIEVNFALIEFMEQNSKRQFQTRPIWISPGHLRNLKMNQFGLSDIIVEPYVQLRALLAAREDLIKEQK